MLKVSFLITTKAIVLIISKFGTGEKPGKRSRTGNTHLTDKEKQNKNSEDWLELTKSVHLTNKITALASNFAVFKIFYYSAIQ